MKRTLAGFDADGQRRMAPATFPLGTYRHYKGDIEIAGMFLEVVWP